MKQDKKLAALIVSRAAMPTAPQPKKRGPEPDKLHMQGDSSNGPNDSEMHGQGYIEAAKQMSEAMKSGDHDGVAQALKDFLSMHKDSET